MILLYCFLLRCQTKLFKVTFETNYYTERKRVRLSFLVCRNCTFTYSRKVNIQNNHKNKLRKKMACTNTCEAMTWQHFLFFKHETELFETVLGFRANEVVIIAPQNYTRTSLLSSLQVHFIFLFKADAKFSLPDTPQKGSKSNPQIWHDGSTICPLSASSGVV